jgi:hypothetical protein
VFRLAVGSTKSGSARRKRAPAVIARLFLLLFVVAAPVCFVEDGDAFASPLLQLGAAPPAFGFVLPLPECGVHESRPGAGDRQPLRDPPPAPSLRAPPAS